MSKIDLYNQSWIDFIFSGRNKDYGAYKLRKESLKDLRKAWIIATLVFVPLVTLPMIIEAFGWGEAKTNDDVIYTEVELAAPPPVDENEPPPPPPPPPAEPPPPKVDKIKFPPPVVKPDEEVVEEEVPTVEELAKADPGQETVEGDPDADIVIEEPEDFGKGDKVVEDNSVKELFAVEVYPQFPGGEEAMQKYIYKNIRYPVLAKENNVQGRVFLSFVVEKDGSVTDVKVLRGIGGGCDEEAIRVIKAMPKWSPAIQNGRKVRVKYSIPIVYKLQN